MALLLLSFLAGILTVAAPCVLPLLPVIVGSVANDHQASRWRPVVITLGLVLSVIVFTLLLKASTILLGVPQEVWQVISGGIVVLFGIHFLSPSIWETIAERFSLQGSSQRFLQSAKKQEGLGGSFLLGAALGPVFNSCSPTYGLIVAAILPVSFSKGLVYLVAYALGLGITLLLVGYLGRAIVQRLGWLANPNGGFKKTIGVLFILVGLLVILGLDKKIQATALERGWYDPIANLERLLQ